MKKTIFKMMIPFIALTLGACVGPAKIDKLVEILPNQSAYVIPLEGNTKAQGKFDSADYLEAKKVASKRIYLPQKQLNTGRMWWDYEWIPTVRVITVDRAPITFEWEGRNGIEVESKDSIGFTIGTNISAHIKETDTSTFLYNYPSGNLGKVLGKIVKSKATELLSREFAKHNLPQGRAKKGEIVDKVKRELASFFAKSGVTISTYGLTGGLTYDDKEIQTAINDNFRSELEIKNAENEKIQQREVNLKNISIAIAEKKQALHFQQAAKARTQQVKLEIEKMRAEAYLKQSEKWDGGMPKNMMPANSSFLFSVDTQK